MIGVVVVREEKGGWHGTWWWVYFGVYKKWNSMLKLRRSEASVIFGIPLHKFFRALEYGWLACLRDTRNLLGTS